MESIFDAVMSSIGKEAQVWLKTGSSHRGMVKSITTFDKEKSRDKKITMPRLMTIVENNGVTWVDAFLIDAIKIFGKF